MFKETIETIDELEQKVGKPGKIAANKVINYIDDHCYEFISLSPFLTISTCGADGSCDVSPRGDDPGFVHVVDDNHLVIPERPGNKRVDSIRNILENRNIGMLFIIPGVEETLRINGKATIIQDAAILEKMAAKGHVPTVGIGVKVEEVFIHCAKAFKRSQLWDPSTWLAQEDRPRPAKILAEHAKALQMNEQQVASSLHESYTKRLY
ncbi:pyridoxamine 5'-phosphate oxidase family protein [Pontibacillus yanchengensis]|uniref:Pyridoxamine 5'-phosphate oxidase family protein n=2 Tax=Pontibacillus yanchengensis TaxID=462910 RepID=A0ACC7VLV9_9BACI|nr:pyridoxamine 5'-phosphate oxidase family protein [Pontibacillus yanchengensis]MYL35043.1 pyridoxamine 5'-phosphate oxidase family protein [Pontibacillus yanchengensis]MYL55246.1 pyridoxamine 5'-phosphate oxidase family protein [Pontibacillus yanchengensis]